MLHNLHNKGRTHQLNKKAFGIYEMELGEKDDWGNIWYLYARLIIYEYTMCNISSSLLLSGFMGW